MRGGPRSPQRRHYDLYRTGQCVSQTSHRGQLKQCLQKQCSKHEEGLGMGDPQRGKPPKGLAWTCSQPVLPAVCTTEQWGEVVFAPDSAFSSATGCDINALGGSKGGCESQKRTQRETTFPEHLLVPCTISLISSNSVRRSIIFGL